MNKEKKISDKKIEKILNKCMILISKGYNVDFCLNKFKKYKDILEEYLAIYGKLKKATNFELDKNFLEDTLDKIYAHSSEKYNISVSKPRRNFELKPAILLSVVIVIISFSFVGIMFASQNSVPGEILYPVKRIVENFELSVYPESHMGPLHFDLLNNRLYEANKVVGSAIYNKDTVNSLLTEVDYEYRQSKKYNYFGNKTEDQILNDIKDIKIRYQKKQVQEQQENKSSEIKSNNMDFEIDGPVYVKEQNIFCYRVNIKGDKISSGLVVEFNRDDSNGIWGPYAAQINLNPGETFILTVTIPSLSVSKSFTLVGPDNPDENVETETSQDETNGDENKTTEYNQTTEGIKDIQCPVTSNAVAVPNPAAVNSSVTITATVDDTATGGSNIASAEYSLDNEITWTALDPTDGIFDGAIEDVTGILNITAPGVYDLRIRGIDAEGNISNPASTILVVYNPMGGFITGNGWINSQMGACKSNIFLAGKAIFNFDSKYLNGATVPTGNIDFQLKEANLNFHSSNYNWLVTTPGSKKAQIKGTGTINGTGNYNFMLWTADGIPDLFHIKIWIEENGRENIIYDNDMDQPIEGGNILFNEK